MKILTGAIAIILALAQVGCVKTRNSLPPLPPDLPLTVLESNDEGLSEEPKQRYLYWEHDGIHTPGFTVEERADLNSGWFTIGFLSVTNYFLSHETNFFYRFPVPPRTNRESYYRVGSIIPGGVP